MNTQAMSMMNHSDTTEKLTGTVNRIIFQNGTYYVFQMYCRGTKKNVTVSGQIPSLKENQMITVTGTWKVHPRYGLQFAMDKYTLMLPTTTKGIEAYLAGGMIHGIGPVMAKRLVQAFGEDTLRVLQEEPDKVKTIPGIGPQKAQKIKESLTAHREIEKIMVALRGMDVSQAYAIRIYKHFGTAACNVIADNPYRLTEVHGIGFRVADRIALQQGVPKDAMIRLKAGMIYLMEHEAARSGHVCLPHDELVKTAAEQLECSEALVEQALSQLLQDKQLVCRDLESTSWYYSPALYGSEQGTSTRLRHLAAKARPLIADPAKALQLLQKVEKRHNITLTDEQRRAVLTAVAGGCCVITGGPGTGKTTLTRLIVEMWEKKRRTVLLASPTGRAAKRLSECTQRSASTIHRLLGWDPSDCCFVHNEEMPLECDLLIIDEASMVDAYLIYQVLKAVPEGASLILVGDVDQLPSVGPGRVLRDIIESGVIPVVRLTHIHRQGPMSLIVHNAHRINQGKPPIQDENRQFKKDMFFINKETPTEVCHYILKLVSEVLPKKIKCDPIQDIQVLTPMHKTECGVENLNRELQRILNPQRPGQPSLAYMGHEYRPGDKVLQKRNNYPKNVFNGDIGFIENVNPETKSICVLYEGIGTVEYAYDELDEIVHAYAMTVHKSQGSEFPIIVMPLHSSHYIMLQRNLLYTAITRGKKLVILVGNGQAMKRAVENNTIPLRYSHLATLLRS